MKIIKSRVAAAKALNVTERTLANWKNTTGFPADARGYHIDRIRAWRAKAIGIKRSDLREKVQSLTRRVERLEKALAECSASKETTE